MAAYFHWGLWLRRLHLILSLGRSSVAFCGRLRSKKSVGACQQSCPDRVKVTDSDLFDCGSHLNFCAARILCPMAKHPTMAHLRHLRTRLVTRSPFGCVLTFQSIACLAS